MVHTDIRDLWIFQHRHIYTDNSDRLISAKLRHSIALEESHGTQSYTTELKRHKWCKLKKLVKRTGCISSEFIIACMRDSALGRVESSNNRQKRKE